VSKQSKLHQFERKSSLYEKWLLRYIRNYLKAHQEELIEASVKKDWKKFDEIILGLKEKIVKRLMILFEDFGSESLNEF
jgi:hypothetical protein